jgi:hypothetical protein
VQSFGQLIRELILKLVVCGATHGRRVENNVALKDIAPMATLEDDEIKTIVKDVAVKNHVPVEIEDISTEFAIDSDGLDAIEIVISLAPSIRAEIPGENTARTVVDVHLRLAEAGEERLPIVWIG